MSIVNLQLLFLRVNSFLGEQKLSHVFVLEGR